MQSLFSVTVDAGKGSVVSGDVTAVDASDGEPKLIVAGNPYSISAVLRVEPGILTAPVVTPEKSGGA